MISARSSWFALHCTKYQALAVRLPGKVVGNAEALWMDTINPFYADAAKQLRGPLLDLATDFSQEWKRSWKTELADHGNCAL
ncbi:hypothetical protein EMIT0P291_100026 [Pseudomonas sp. IT-P291]